MGHTQLNVTVKLKMLGGGGATQTGRTRHRAKSPATLLTGLYQRLKTNVERSIPELQLYSLNMLHVYPKKNNNKTGYSMNLR